MEEEEKHIQNSSTWNITRGWVTGHLDLSKTNCVTPVCFLYGLLTGVKTEHVIPWISFNAISHATGKHIKWCKNNGKILFWEYLAIIHNENRRSY